MPGGEQVPRCWGLGWFVCHQQKDRMRDRRMTFSNHVGMTREKRGDGNMEEKAMS